MILVYRLIMYTDHKKLTCKTFNTDIVLRWRKIVKDHGPGKEYIEGNKNIESDKLSRLTLNGN